MSQAAGRRSVIRGLRGLRDIVWTSAVLATLAQVPGITRVRSVRSHQGEVEVDGVVSLADVRAALLRASAWMDAIRAAGDVPATVGVIALEQVAVEPAA